MDLSLAHLKKVLKFGIVLGGIYLVGLESSFGTYTPSSLKDREITWATITSFGSDLSHWAQTTMVKNYGSEALVRQSIVPSVMVDSTRAAYMVNCASFNEKGINICLLKYNQQGQLVSFQYFSPWHRVNSSINCEETPNLSILPDNNPKYFKNYIHNAFQPCIAQEVGKYSDYLYVFFYVPPTRYMNPSNGKDDEGILMLKIRKSDLSVIDQEFHSGHDQNNHFSFHHQRPRRDSDSHVFGAECGNYQAWVDTDDSGTDHVHLNWIALETKEVFSTAKIYEMYKTEVGYHWNSQFYAGSLRLNFRMIKYDDYIYTCYGEAGWPIVNKHKRNQLHSDFGKFTLNWTGPFDSPFGFIFGGDAYNSYTAINHDFCIVDNDNEEGNPIFCILGLRATSEASSTVTSLCSTETNKRWSSKCINDPSKIVLILSSYAWDGTKEDFVTKNMVAEDPQNIIYSTGKTTAESCTVDCGCYTNDKGDYEENQLFKNTHKLVTYTSDSGSKYIIYCYCYPGKSKQLFLGYAPYYIANNKVHLLTKTEFKSPPSSSYPMGESFGNFTSCSRIISMNCKNGQLWITWMNKDDTQYYYFHIAAKDLVGE